MHICFSKRRATHFAHCGIWELLPTATALGQGAVGKRGPEPKNSRFGPQEFSVRKRKILGSEPKNLHFGTKESSVRNPQMLGSEPKNLQFGTKESSVRNQRIFSSAQTRRYPPS